MDMKIPEWVKPAVWGALVGVAAIAAVAFSAGWVVTTGTAEKIAESQAEEAVVAALTPICIAQFRKATEEQQATHLAAIKGERSWEQGDYVGEQGWATLPGSTESNDEVAEACAKELLKAAQT